MAELEIRQSRVGKRPVALPKGVTVQLKDGKIEVQGPKGKLSRALPTGVLAAKEGEAIVVKAEAVGVDHARIQGLGRALIAAMIKG